MTPTPIKPNPTRDSMVDVSSLLPKLPRRLDVLEPVVMIPDSALEGKSNARSPTIRKALRATSRRMDIGFHSSEVRL